MESTPTMNTPNIFGGGSSAVHTLGGMTPRSPGWASPSFTPAHGGRDMMFTPAYGNTPSYSYDMSHRSPSRTPLNLPNQTPLQQTPQYHTYGLGAGMSPAPAGSSYYNPRSEMKSPYYMNSPNSPNYSNSSFRNSSQSPNYSHSPMDSHYSHSPSYSPVADQQRKNEAIKEDEDENDDDLVDDF